MQYDIIIDIIKRSMILLLILLNAVWYYLYLLIKP